MSLIYNIGKGLGKFCFNAFGRLEVTGRENVPPFGPLIIVANHLSFTDPPVLVCTVPRTLYFLGKRELFSNPVTGFIMRNFHVHAFDRSGLGVDAVRMALRLLDQDRAVVIFPEGRRSPNHELIEGVSGAAYMALKSQAPIMPIGVTGTEKIPGWRMPVSLTRFRVNIGQPFSLPVVEGTPSKDVMASVTDMMMNRIADLLPPEYRGKYAASEQDQHRRVQPRTPQPTSSGPKGS